jgi:hypothetical protein
MDKSSLTEQLINDLLTSLRSTKEFVLAQAPDVVKQILTWNLWVHLIWIIFGFAVGLFGVIFFGHLRKSKREGCDERFMCGIAQLAFCIAFAVIFMSNIFEVVQILVAPKLYLIEYFSNLLRPHSS